MTCTAYVRHFKPSERILPVNYFSNYSCIRSHHSFEFLLREAHVLDRGAVVQLQVGVEDQGVVCVQGVVDPVRPEPAQTNR